MRIIRLKFSQKVKAYLSKELSKQFTVEDVGFLEDLLALLVLKGNGLPSNDRIDSLAKALSAKTGANLQITTILMKKRRQVLTSLTNAPYFPALRNVDPIRGLSKLVLMFATMYRKVREVQCKSCHLFSQCQFGQEYADKTLDIRRALDKDWDKKVSQNCPNYPDISAVNQMNEAMQQMHQMGQQGAQQQAVTGTNPGLPPMPVFPPGSTLVIDDMITVRDPDDEDDFKVPVSIMGGGAGAPGDVNVGYSASAYLDKLVDLAKNLSEKDLLIYELGAKMDFMLDQARKDKMRDVKHVAKATEVDKIKETNEVGQVLPSELAAPNDVFYGKLAKKELKKTQNKDPQAKKHLLYVLVDVSASMTAALSGSGPTCVLTREELAKVFTLSLARRLMKEDGMLYLRHFSTSAGPLVKVEGPADFKFFIDSVAMQYSNGAGTSIVSAISTALDDIEQAKDKLREADILMITDAEDTLDPTQLQGMLSKFKKNPLNVLDIAATQFRITSQRPNAASKVLKAHAAKYYHVDPSESVKLEDMVKLVSS